MIQLILKKSIEPRKMNALLDFLKLWDIDAEVKKPKVEITRTNTAFDLAAGIWEDATIDAKELRKKAWNQNK
jgi:hypothetical protein